MVGGLTSQLYTCMIAVYDPTPHAPEPGGRARGRERLVSGSAPRRALSGPAAAVLRALAEGASYGFDVMDATGLPSGTVYPILSRSERQGWVESRWEDPEEHRREGRPARKYYRLTRDGRAALAAAVERFRALGRPLGGEA